MDTVTVLLSKKQAASIARLVETGGGVGSRKWYVLGEAVAMSGREDLAVDFTSLEGVEALTRRAGMVW